MAVVVTSLIICVRIPGKDTVSAPNGKRNETVSETGAAMKADNADSADTAVCSHSGDDSIVNTEYSDSGYSDEETASQTSKKYETDDKDIIKTNFSTGNAFSGKVFLRKYIIPIAAYVQMKCEDMDLGSEQNYWISVFLAAVSCHDTGFLSDNNEQEHYYIEPYYDFQHTTAYAVSEELVDALGRAFTGESLSPSTVPEGFPIVYHKENRVYYFAYSRRRQLYSAAGFKKIENNDSITWTGVMSDAAYGLDLKRCEYSVTLETNPDCELFGKSVSDVQIKRQLYPEPLTGS